MVFVGESMWIDGRLFHEIHQDSWICLWDTYFFKLQASSAKIDERKPTAEAARQDQNHRMKLSPFWWFLLCFPTRNHLCLNIFYFYVRSQNQKISKRNPTQFGDIYIYIIYIYNIYVCVFFAVFDKMMRNCRSWMFPKNPPCLMAWHKGVGCAHSRPWKKSPLG